MKAQSITSTKEDYIRALFLLGNQTGVVELAHKLGLSKSTVSERLEELKKQGFVVRKRYKKLSLTKKGEDLAKKLTYKHRVIEVFLHNFLNLSKNKVHEEAHKLEHAVSDEVIKRLGKFVGNPKLDPHGKPIERLLQ